jgi:DNA-binding NtrC family response regulator
MIRDGGGFMIWPAQVLVIAQESKGREKLQRILQTTISHVFCYTTLLEAQSFLSGHDVDAIFAELRMPDGDFQDLIKEVEHFQPGVPIVALGQPLDLDSNASSAAFGAFNFLPLLASGSEIKRIIWSALDASFTRFRPLPVATEEEGSIISRG